MVEVPENEVERIRWGIHSLCQHTKTQQPGPTPAFVATGPEPSRPPGLCPNGSPGCHTPWSRAPTPPLGAHRRTGALSGAAGDLEYHRLQLLGCWGTGALHSLLSRDDHTRGARYHHRLAQCKWPHGAKLTEILWLIRHTALDVLILVDVHCSSRQLKFLAKTARDTMGLGSWAHASPARNLKSTEGPKRYEMVGGQLLLIFFFFFFSPKNKTFTARQVRKSNNNKHAEH